jgi:hypothetical protein
LGGCLDIGKIGIAAVGQRCRHSDGMWPM